MDGESRVSYFDATSIAAMFGFGLYWAWLDLTLFSSALTFGIAPDMLPLFRYASLVGLPFAIAFFAAVLRWFQSFASFVLERRVGLLAIAALAALASVLLAFSPRGSVGFALTGLALSGMAMGAMALVWSEACARDRQNRGSVWVPGSIALSCVLYVVVGHLEGPFRFAVLGVFPFASMALAWVVGRTDERSRSESRVSSTVVPWGKLPSLLPWRFALLLFSYSAYFGVMVFLYAQPENTAFASGGSACYLARGGTCLLFFVGMSVFGWKPRIAYKTSILVIIAGFLFLPFLFNRHGPIIEIIAHVGYGCFDCMIWAVLFGLMRAEKVSATVLTSLVRMLTAAGTFVGALITIGVTMSMHPTSEQVTALSSSLVYLIIIILMLILNDGRPDALWGALDEADSFRDRGRGVRAIEAFGDRHGLSAREKDVLVPFVQGRSMPVIAKNLNISINTVKSHVRHIYQKSSVGNKQELIDRLEKETEEGGSPLM